MERQVADLKATLFALLAVAFLSAILGILGMSKGTVFVIAVFVFSASYLWFSNGHVSCCKKSLECGGGSRRLSRIDDFAVGQGAGVKSSASEKTKGSSDKQTRNPNPKRKKSLEFV